MEPTLFVLAEKAWRQAMRNRSRSSAHARDPILNVEWVNAAAHLHCSAERELWRAVEAARNAGASWALIGRALGCSGQAAQQRFSKPPRGRLF